MSAIVLRSWLIVAGFPITRREPKKPVRPSRSHSVMNAIRCIVEAAIYTDDLEAAEIFYRDVLGLPFLGKETGRHVFFEAGEQQVLLVFCPAGTLKGDRLPAHGTRGPGHVALGIALQDLHEWRERLARHQVQIEHEQIWERGGRSLYFRDPGGNSIELVTPGVWGLPSGW
jgi:catechol 2,3-dioxygenase-like lactoylglutathione lyase family enzyme